LNFGKNFGIYLKISSIFAVSNKLKFFPMEALVIESPTKADANFWSDIADRIRWFVQSIDLRAKRDANAIARIKEGLKSEYVSREEVMKILDE